MKASSTPSVTVASQVRQHVFLLCLFSLGLLLSQCTPGNTEAPAQFWVGAAQADITPEVGAYIAGDKQNRRFTGVLDSLYVKAVVVSDGQTSVALLTVDCIGLLYPTVEAIRAAVRNELGDAAPQLVVSSTHTHSGPDVVGMWGPDLQHSGVDTTYMQRLVATAAQQVVLANQRKQAVTARIAQTTHGEGWVENICLEELDSSLTVLQFLDANGTSVATLTNFACHPTYLDAVFDKVSADYVAGFYQRMDEQLGGVNMFLQGAIGGWVQPSDKDGKPTTAFDRGHALATFTQKALQTPDTVQNSIVAYRAASVAFTVENEGWRQLAALGTIQRDIAETVTSEVVWFTIGEIPFITHPGETAPYYSLRSKELLGTERAFVLGLGMDALGYIIKPIYFEDPTKPHAEYLTRMSLGKNTAPTLLTAIEQLASKK